MDVCEFEASLVSRTSSRTGSKKLQRSLISKSKKGMILINNLSTFSKEMEEASQRPQWVKMLAISLTTWVKSLGPTRWKRIPNTPSLFSDITNAPTYHWDSQCRDINKNTKIMQTTLNNPLMYVHSIVHFSSFQCKFWCHFALSCKSQF